ncbi:MAG TPA: tetratricopeptide repeat protein [Planctomycetota bacterium]|nr:tetratricopeptide repeat protein [Planctomycetota bacterium]
MSDLTVLYKRADDAFGKRNYDYARDLYLQIIGLAPNETDARRKLYATILTKFKEQGAPSKLTTKLFIGKVHMQLAATKNPQSRVDVSQKHLLSDPTNDKVRTELAKSLGELGHGDGALEEAKIASECNPGNGDANKLLAALLLKKGQVEEAKQALMRALKAKPEDRDAQKLLRDLEATATMKKGFDNAQSYRDIIKDKSQAEQLEKQAHLVKTDADVLAFMGKLLELHKASPQDVKIIKQIAELHIDQRKDFAAAADWYRKAAALNPFDSVLKDKVEDCEIRRLEVAYQQAKARSDPNAAQMAAQKLAFETKAFERRVADRPTETPLRYELGKRLYLAKSLDAAIKEFQLSVKDPKHRVDSSIYLGNCFQAKKLYDLAETQYKNAEEGALGDDKFIYIWYNWARCCEESGKKDSAIGLYSKIVEKDYGYRDAAQRLEKIKAGA